MTATGGGVDITVGGVGPKGERTHGHGPWCGGDCWGEGAIRGLNGNGKNTRKIKKIKLENQSNNIAV